MLAATKLLWERLYGKPKETLEVQQQDGVDPFSLDLDALLRRAEEERRQMGLDSVGE